MDFACSIQRSNVLFTGEGTSYRIPDRLINSRFRCQGFGCKFFNPRIVSKSRSTRNIRRSIAGGCLDSSLVSIGTFETNLWVSYSNKSLFQSVDGVFKVPRGVILQCQDNDSVAYINGNGRNVEFDSGDERSRVEFADGADSNGLGGDEIEVKEDAEAPSLDELKELLVKAMKELEVAQVNSTMFEEKAQRISENAIALKDEASNAWKDVSATLDMVQEIVNEECLAKETVQKATMDLSLAEARLQVAIESLQVAKEENDSSEGYRVNDTESGDREEDGVLLAAETEIRECQANLANCEAELKRLQSKKEELQKEVDRLNEAAEKAEMNALKAEEEVANIMLLAEQAVAFELEVAQRVNDAEIALQRAEKSVSISRVDISGRNKGYVSGDEATVEEEKMVKTDDASTERERDLAINGDYLISESLPDILSDGTNQILEYQSDEMSDENGKLGVDSPVEAEMEIEKSKNIMQVKKQESQKDLTRESSPLNAPKALLKKSSRFFSASFFSFAVDGTEFTPASVFQGLMESVRKKFPKLVLGFLLIGAGVAFYANRVERNTLQLQQPDVITTSIEEVSSTAKPLIRQMQKLPMRIKKLLAMLPQQEMNEEEASLFDMLWLLLASVIFVPIFQKIPGGSPVLGYLAAGILIGPYGLSIIRHVHGTKAIAEFGVVFLLFNIGLELSVERLSSMKKYVFGLGSAQVLVTAVVVGLVSHFVSGQAGPAAIVIGNGLALSSTAVVLQVLQERGESTSRHGRATFSVLLFQDLAVVVLLILIPLISPNSSKGGVGFQAIAEALGLAAVKAAVAITAIIAGGRLLLRPIYKQIAENQNAEIFSANTLLVILGTSLLTARAGLSMALGAFLAGLLLAETEFSLQVESDIAPYRGLLLGLFFMTVGMSIDPKLLISNFPVIIGTLALLIGGKTLLVALVGRLFGISIISAIRVGLLLAPGGEFAFVAFGEAVNQGIMSSQLSSLLFLVVGISMALTPWLAAGGQLLASRFEQHDVRSLLPVESETDDLQDHIIICGFGRVGQIIAQLLSERLIPFVALDVRSDRVAVGRALDLPVYFGDAGSREVLHKVGAERACAAAITLDTPGANYRAVWALNKYFPNVKTFVRAHDVDHGLNLEKAGATAVVPETLEPSLQLAAAVLAQAKLPMSEIVSTINEYRSRHLSELTELCEATGSSLGYGFNRMTSKPKAQSSDASDENEVTEGTLAI
ncbi:K(+) efflux antiporter 2, chloroplastic isoform X1 [Mangifera indica]|uniref:K(+) efflux antiporter 2, chloroplastic isoform X1 n=1 Tax=Mangifera indica TaxID=29780 RepID=UPI001CFBBC5E|nr:K(+) efflux antiporter 2, chloroplastic isoform X1 [Mangifera indica]XP_044503856.1 K(+) efflux antiporter 2, chloroplastic isoform X1 [Mangifera indica]XP_044503857.1 K(+) efflux antiporter 2, chloroplastic isoform X1 [Mangifera indica]